MKFADDWIRIADLWCQNRPLSQLCINPCPSLVMVSQFCSEKHVMTNNSFASLGPTERGVGTSRYLTSEEENIEARTKGWNLSD